jgi:hypothetical protein
MGLDNGVQENGRDEGFLLERLDKLKFLRFEADLKLGKIKDAIQIAGHMERGKYEQYLKSRLKLRKEIESIEIEKSKIRENLMNIGVNINEIRKDKNREDARVLLLAKEKRKFLFDQIESLRSEYHEFSADSTRVSSMRQMAAEFANKLQALLFECGRMKK